jgi:Fe-Mn family superoxide dismutase
MRLILPPLPYSVDALEPYISRRTLAAHHGHHHSAYVSKARVLTQGTSLEGQDVEKIIDSASSKNVPLYNAGAQVWNHAFYWASMRPGGGGAAQGAVAELVEHAFGSQSSFNEQFMTLANDVCGSGWVWLVLDQDTLRLMPTSNADNPLSQGVSPLLVLDLWEHAYYLDYEHRRSDYVAAFLAHLVDWNIANRRLQAAMARRSARVASASR